MTNTTDIKNELESILEDLIFDTDNSYGWPPDFEPNFPKAVAAIQALIDRAVTEQKKAELVLVDVGGHTELRTRREMLGKNQSQSFSMVLMSLDAQKQLDKLSNTTGEGK